MARRPIRHTDTTLGWQVREFRALWKAIREMRAERRLGQSEVEEGGDLRIRGLLSVLGELVVTGIVNLTGTLSMRSDAGAEMVRLGDMTYGRGLGFTRSDGTEAYVLAKAFSNSDTETWGLFDRNGDTIVSEEPLWGGGLARPRLEYPFQPVAATSGTPTLCGPYGFERSSTSDVWETLFVYEGRRQNVFLDLKFAAMCSDATTSGEIRAINLATGNQLVQFFGVPWEADVPVGTTSMTVIDPQPYAAVLPGEVDDYLGVGLQVRRTAGTGSITASVVMAIGG